jgi:hypothetical protein
LQGPVAAELWDVDVRLGALRQRRELLLERLRSGAPDEPAPAPLAAPWPTPAAPAAGTPAWTPPVRKEWTPQRIQNTLLSLGVLLLAVAALVATAVAYRQVGAAGRAAVLLAVTAVAVGASAWTRRKSLTASAEATAVLAVVLAVVSARALRRAGTADQVSAESFWTAATAAVALGSALLARRGALAYGLGAALVGQAPLLITASRQDGAAVSAVLSLQIALLVAGYLLAERGGVAGRTAIGPVLLVSAALTAIAATGTGIEAAYPDQGSVRSGVAALCLLAVVLAAGAVTLRALGGLRHVLTAAATGLALAALAAPARMSFSATEVAAVVAVGALIAAVATSVLPLDWQLGPAVGAALGGLAALRLVAEPVAQAVAGPLTWLSDPWSRDSGSARAAVMVSEHWTGEGMVAVVMVVTAATAVVLGVLARRTTLAGYPVVLLALIAVVVTPLAVDTTYQVAVAWDLAVAVAALLLGPALRRRARLPGYACSGLGAALLVLACAWSVADERTSTVVLAVAAVACAAAAWLDGLLDAALSAPLAALATGLVGADTFAVAHSAGAPLDRSGFILAAVACGGTLVVGHWRPRTADGLAVELTATALVAAALLATATDAGWTSWTLAVAGLAALATALRPERRPVSYLGALLLAASSWVRLADAHVHAPEPYVVPLAVVALGLGVLRRRADRGVSSWTAYGPALSLGLLPSLVASLDDSSARRPLLLAVAATAVVVVGAVRRLQAPLVVGGVVLAADAVRQLGAYVALLPRWVVIAALGLILLVLGTTFEQRRRDVQRIQQSFDRMS